MHNIDDCISVSYFMQRSQLCSCQPFCTADFSTSPAMLAAEDIYRRPSLGTGQLAVAAAGSPPAQHQPHAGWAPGSAPHFPRKPLSPRLINCHQITCVAAAGVAASPSLPLVPAVLGSVPVALLPSMGLPGCECPAPRGAPAKMWPLESTLNRRGGLASMALSVFIVKGIAMAAHGPKDEF